MQVVITADERTNSLVASGSRADLALIQTLIKQFDVPPAETDARTTEVFVLELADANGVARAIAQALVPRRGQVKEVDRV